MSECSTSSRNLDIINISDYNKELWKDARQPLSVTFELTPRCNFRCVHCYLGTHRDEVQELSTQEVKNILDQLSDIGLLFVTFTGGECMMRRDFSELYLYAKRLGFMVCIFTNGFSFTDGIFELFQAYPPFFIDVSIYGASAETYRIITGVRNGFRMVMDNLNKMKKLGLAFGIKTPVFEQNIEDYPEMCRIARELGVKYRFSFGLSPTIDKEDYPTTYMVPPATMIRLESEDPVYREMGENYATVENLWGDAYDQGEFVPLFICAPGVNDMFINYKGEVMPCASFRSEAQSMLEKPLRSIWEVFAKYRKIPASASYRCMRCRYRYYCRVCPADQLQYEGDIESVSPQVCAHARARYRLFKQHLPIETVIERMEADLASRVCGDPQ